MQHRISSLGRSMTAAIGLVASTVAIVAIAPVQAATLDRWQFDPATNQLVISLPQGVTPKYYLAAEPARIIIDLPQTEVGAVPLQQTYQGAVRQIRVAQFQPGVVRIVLELSPNAVLAPDQVELKQLEATAAATQWALRPLLVGDSPSIEASTSVSPTPETATSAPENQPSPSASAPSTLPAAPANLAATSPAATSSTATTEPIGRSNSAESESEAVTVNEPAATESEGNEALAANSATSVAPASNSVSDPGSGLDSNPALNSASNPSAAYSSNASLPPLEPGAIEIPVEAATTPQISTSESAQAVAAGSTSSRSSTSGTPSTAIAPGAPPSTAPPSTVTPSTATPSTSAISSSVSAIPPEPNQLTHQPPADGGAAALALPNRQLPVDSAATPALTNSPLSFPSPTSGTVSVPSIDTVASSTPNSPVDPAALPPATIAQSQSAASQSAVPFGQPIPSSNSASGFTSSGSTSSGSTSSGSTHSGTRSAARSTPASPAPAPPASPPAPPAATTAAPATAPSAATTTPASLPFGQPIPTAQPSAPTPTKIQVIPFGQPLPAQSSTQRFDELTTASLAIPSGTVLKLRYAGEVALELGENPHQEVLLLEQAVTDRSGNVVLPVGSPVIGRFETTQQGSQFIAQAVEIQGKTVALNAQSDQLSGARQVNQDGLLRNSAIGAVAGTLLGAVTGVGLIPAIIAGAASSAATTYVTSPDAAIIQPNQVVEVRLTQDWLQSMQ